MTGLLADGWFYISSAGLLVSGVLFFFLLSQYRAAGDAADQPEAEAAAELQAPVVRPLYFPDEPASSPKVASVPAEKPADKAPVQAAAAPPEPKREAAPAPVEPRRESATAAVNPAVVYLQNIKNQLEEIHNENRVLAKQVEAITSRDEALIERLAELTQAVADLKGANAALAPVETPAPKRVKKNEAPAVAAIAKAEAPAAAPVAVAPVALAPAEMPALIEPTTVVGVPAASAEPKPEVLFSAEEVARLAPAPAAEILPAPVESVAPPAQSIEEPESDRPRRGPVWPV
jgi:hypothetical protein